MARKSLNAKSKKRLKEQAKEIIKIAEENGVQSNYFFVTTFERYQMQLKILDKLEQDIEEYGNTVTKEYVKGRNNLYTNPALKDYNTTTDSANRTVSTLMKIIKNYNVSETTEDDDPLFKIINGSDGDE